MNGNTQRGSSLSSRRPPRASFPRKKACQQCSAGKMRCDLNRPRCSRCEVRRTVCEYTLAKPVVHSTPLTVRDTSTVDLSNDSSHVVSPQQHSLISKGVGFREPANPGIPAEKSGIFYWTSSPLNFVAINLICTIDPTRIRNRWLSDFIPSLTDRVKMYAPEVSSFVFRVLKTYPSILLSRGQLPPFIHPSQLAGPDIPTPLANCLSLVRLWDGQVRGSEAIVCETIKKEMDRLYAERASYNQMDKLSACQAYLIYSMMLFFSRQQGQSLVDRQIMINLLDFACDIAQDGLVCPGEISKIRPDWESWIVACAKRRTLYTLYFFDNIFCAAHNLPTFLGEELESLPAPARKSLWDARDRNTWEKTYALHLTEWPEGAFRINELWPDMSPDNGEKKKRRVDKWLQSVDEYGMMLFAVTHITHGI
ncbi:hypothetical protein OIDMADRAFT_102728 [Oidiodendron maius Zn]|uniref:Zn(2)-C6 fungal-type domain-containing protein n=1 Tax=Oidiodendron maius (strain Zn) TaxID=913774 RepID=A0A0C3HJX2_OIDMZ|nr:hypothetical protein OIDMADRAFT_102728 [Oidiodendron maius Zn]